MLLCAESPDAVADACLEVLSERLDLARGSVSELDYEREETIVLAAVGEASHLSQGERMRMADGDVLRRYRTSERIDVPDLCELEQLSSVERKLLDIGVRSYVNIPLVVDAELVGSLNLGSPHPHGFPQEDLELSQELAGLVAIAIREARLRQDLRARSADLERIDAWRRGLVNMLAHDIRSPLSTVSSTLQLIVSRVDSLARDQLLDLLQMADRCSRRSLDLADDLLVAARSEEGRLVVHRSQVDVPPLVLAVVEKLHLPQPPVIHTPPELAAVRGGEACRLGRPRVVGRRGARCRPRRRCRLRDHRGRRCLVHRRPAGRPRLGDVGERGRWMTVGHSRKRERGQPPRSFVVMRAISPGSCVS